MSLDVPPKATSSLDRVTTVESRLIQTVTASGTMVWTVHQGKPRRLRTLNSMPSEEDRLKFNQLAQEWREQTFLSSSLSANIAHPSHLKILAMGERALPLILTELRDRGGYWFTALDYVVDDPVENPITDDIRYIPQKMREAWLEWGHQNHYL